MTRIIAELGSCHMGKLERIKEAIDVCKDLKLELKLQLFPNEAPYVPTNVYLSPEVFKLAFEYAQSKDVVLSASTFDMFSYYYLRALNPHFIKFAFSKKGENNLIKDSLSYGIETIVSCDVMTAPLVPKGAVKLYCIPEYPVRYEVDFDGLFDLGFPGGVGKEQVVLQTRFDGFSDHTMGLRQTQNAIDSGAKIIEKHVRLGYADETCPDAFFAVNIFDLKILKRDKNNGY